MGPLCTLLGIAGLPPGHKLVIGWPRGQAERLTVRSSEIVVLTNGHSWNGAGQLEFGLDKRWPVERCKPLKSFRLLDLLDFARPIWGWKGFGVRGASILFSLLLLLE